MYSYWQLTDFIEQSSSLEATRSATSLEILLNWLHLLVHYCIHRHLPPIPILSEINPIHASPFHFSKIHFAFILPPMPRFSKWFLSLRSPHQNCVFMSPVSHTWRIAPSISFVLITWIIFGEEYKSWISSTSPLPCYVVALRSKYLPQHPVPRHPQPVFLPQCERQSFTPIQNKWKNCSSLYFNLDIFVWETERQNFLHWMIVVIHWLHSAHNILMDFWFVSIVPKYLNCATPSKDLLPIFMLWFCPAGCTWHDHIHCVLSSY